MATEELKKIIKEGEKKIDAAGTGADINNSSESIKKLEDEGKVKDKQIADLKFSNEFQVLESKYPLAKEHQDVIRQKVDAGYSVEDAVVSVLTKENKLKTADQITAENNKGADLGGSSRTPNLNSTTGTKEKSAEELGKELQEFERKGEFRLG